MNKKSFTGIEAVAVGIVALVMIVVLMGLGALITMLTWNYGVVAFVAACGGAVGKIGFWVSLFINIAWCMITRPFRAQAKVKS